MPTLTTTTVDGPYFDDLAVGDVFAHAPGLTLTEGHAAQHQAILGDRLLLALDRDLDSRVRGADGVLAHPGLVIDVAIGQSSVVTQRVVANLFYRGLVLHRAPVIGDTLRTQTQVVALRQNSRRPDRAPTGLAVLRITTVDQQRRKVLDFWRCAMLPLSDPDLTTSHADDLSLIPDAVDLGALQMLGDHWDLATLREAAGGPALASLAAGDVFIVSAGDVVSSAPELARLTLNVAAVHVDRHRTRDGRRLVYGGHTIGIAAAQVARALPGIAYIGAWQGCDHMAPVYEGDTLNSRVEVMACEAGGLVHLRSLVEARGDDAATTVLDWRYVALMA